jgi:hypothetical protein
MWCTHESIFVPMEPLQPKYQKKKKKLARTKRCQVFPPGALPRGGNCVELASGGLAGATLSREIDL